MHRSIQNIFDRRAMLDRAHDGPYLPLGRNRRIALAGMVSCWHAARRHMQAAHAWRRLGNERMVRQCVDSAQCARREAKRYRRDAATHPSGE